MIINDDLSAWLLIPNRCRLYMWVADGLVPEPIKPNPHAGVEDHKNHICGCHYQLSPLVSYPVPEPATVQFCHGPGAPKQQWGVLWTVTVLKVLHVGFRAAIQAHWLHLMVRLFLVQIPGHRRLRGLAEDEEPQ